MIQRRASYLREKKVLNSHLWRSSYPPPDILLARHQSCLALGWHLMGGVTWVVVDILLGLLGCLDAWLSCLSRVTNMITYSKPSADP